MKLTHGITAFSSKAAFYSENARYSVLETFAPDLNRPFLL